jgi:hypothetical protein
MLPHTVTSKIYDRLLGLEYFDWNTHFKELFQKCTGACNLGAEKKDVKPKSNTQLSLPLDDLKGLKVAFSLGIDGRIKSLSVPLEASVSDIVFQRIVNFLSN